MEPTTGKLIAVTTEELPEGYIEIPPELQEEAARAIAAAAPEEAIVPLDGKTPLSQFRRDHLRKKAKLTAKRRRKKELAKRRKK